MLRIFLHQRMLSVEKRGSLEETVCRERTVRSGKIVKDIATI